MAKPATAESRPIAENRRARHEYYIEERFEAGLALQGWEVKALRSGKAQITESYVYERKGEMFVTGMHITPLKTTSTHVLPEPTRTRKLLLNRREIDKLAREVANSGRTIVPLSIYFSDGYAKVELAIATGKKDWDKRATIAERDANREAQRAMAVRNKRR